jgi:hypothetical protein
MRNEKKNIKFILLEDSPSEFDKYSNLIKEVLKKKGYKAIQLFDDFDNKVKKLIEDYSDYEDKQGLYPTSPDKKLYLSSRCKNGLSNVIIFVDIAWRDSGGNDYGLKYCRKCLLVDQNINFDNVIALTKYTLEDKFAGIKHFVHKGADERKEIWQNIAATEVFRLLQQTEHKVKTTEYQMRIDKLDRNANA